MFEYDPATAEIWIYDELGPAWWGLIDAGSVIAALKEMRGKRATVRLNTPGGSVDEGIAIYNAMRQHPGGVDVVVDSLAASMGSYLLQAGERRIVTKNAMVMVHDPWTIAIGNAAEMRQQAEILDKYRDRMVPDYAQRSGKTVDEINSLMAAETWMAGQEIVDMGFADEISGESAEPLAVAAGMFRNAPAAITKQRAAGSRTPFPAKRERAKALAAMAKICAIR